MDGKSNRPALVSQSTGDRLADPPRGICRELEALSPIEFLDRANQAKVAFLDEVEEIEAPPRVALGDRDDEPEIGAYEDGLGFVGGLDRVVKRGAFSSADLLALFDVLLGLLPGFDGSCEPDFVLSVEQAVVGDLSEIATDCVRG